MTVREAFNSALEKGILRDEHVFIIGDSHLAQVTKGMLNKIDEKCVVDITITEMGVVGLSVGSAFTGLRPICAIDQIVKSGAKTLHMFNDTFLICPIVFCGPNGAAAGVAVQHSQD
ncbi:hypothetical protein CERSUDRAFT_99033 [Gelatoporia subvermispora B]|uniref:Pyruvate dehydrogenase E1 component subunit beta n=1 Tax=Ceriporiopsis subvermispora (strain B) TaxID=914234 RepID=M2QLK6_CERS8|nr:hypothetical protein CERSUDRAFT_99033 [Gelatoporia subvermispora B]